MNRLTFLHHSLGQFGTRMPTNTTITHQPDYGCSVFLMSVLAQKQFRAVVW